jgi:TonB family protein
MKERNPSLTISLCASLIAHGLGLVAMAWWYIEHTPLPHLAPINRYQVMVDQMSRKMNQEQPPKPRPEQKKPRPKPEDKVQKPNDTHKDDSGEANGTGTANRSTSGQQPMQANAGYEQADLMKDADKFADDAFLPASAGSTQSNNSDKQKSPKAGTYAPQFVAQAAPQNDAVARPVVAPASSNGPGPFPKPQAPQGAVPMESGTKNPVNNVPVAQLPTPKPVQKEIRGHRATQSDTESIALAKTNSLTFKAGKVEGRKGLKVQSTMPRFGLASEVDIEQLGGVHTVLEARVDADGNVLDVQIVQTSGSNNIDEDCKRAVYNWIMEPAKDKDGHPTDFLWTIAFE